MSGESKFVHPTAAEVAGDAGSGGSIDRLRIGDKIEIVDADGGDDVRHATVTRFLTDEEQGLSPEIEEYIARWIEVTLDGITGQGARQMVTFGTGSQYWMNGRHVLLRKAAY